MSTLHLQQFVNYISVLLPRNRFLFVSSAPVVQDSFCICLSVSRIFKAGVCPVSFPLFQIQEQLLIFHLFSFVLVRMELKTLKFIICKTRNQKALVFFHYSLSASQKIIFSCYLHKYFHNFNDQH